MIKKIFIYGLKSNPKDLPYVKELFQILENNKSEIRIFKDFSTELLSNKISHNYPTISSHIELAAFNPDAVFTMGGDGTILNAVTLIRDLETPILGINLGRLGFLASLEDYKVSEALQKFYNGEFTIQKRTMLELNSQPSTFGDINFALNDCTILKRDTSSMITVHAYINNEFLNSYWADGIIISTATGSTGYSLSGGGPIIFPNSGNFLITPVAPHNLTARPIVFPETSEIRIKVEGRSENFLCTLDARYEMITAEHEIVICKCPFSTHLIRLEGESFMDTIRNKLAWGRDSRN